MQTTRLKRALAVLLAVAVVPACAARQPGSPLKPGFNMFSKQQDIQLGQEAAQQVRQQYQVVQNRELQAYISRIGERLAQQPDAGGFPYTFTLLNDKSVNAFALPGGPAFVFTGLLQAADNEAQVAGVLAHEISHVALRHGTNQASKANLIQLPAMLAGAIAGGSMLGQLAQLGIGLGANSVLLKYSRDAESQADALGSHLMAAAGWNPLEMARFFEKLEAEGGARGPQFFSDHPNPGNRMRAIEAEIRTLPQRNYSEGSSEFQRMKSMLGGLPAPSRQRQYRSSADMPTTRPTGGFREVRGQYYILSYPDNWQVFGDNDSAMLTIAPREGLVQDRSGNPQVGYGAILAYFFPERNTRNVRDGTEELIHHLHAANPTMQPASNDRRRVRIDGYDGLVTMLVSASPYGGDEQDALLTVARPEGLFYMVFIAPANNFRDLQGTFDQMIRSIRFAR